MAKGKAGAPRGKRKGAVHLPPTVEPAWIRAVVDDGLSASPIKSAAAKVTLGVSWRALLQEQERLRMIAEAGEISADEARQISATATGIRKTIEALGLVVKQEEDLEGLL